MPGQRVAVDEHDGPTAAVVLVVDVDVAGVLLAEAAGTALTSTSVAHGIDEFRAASEAFADDERNPVAHHVTDIIVSEAVDGGATVRSKGIGVLRDGRAGSVTYNDRVTRTTDGWRITARQELPSSGSPERAGRKRNVKH
jgi:hypothetical protein